MLWYQHLIIGFVLFFSVLYLYYFYSESEMIGGSVDTKIFFILGLPILLGSILPDIDHPFSKIRKLFNLFLLFLAFIFSFSFITSFVIIFDLKPPFYSIFLSTFVLTLFIYYGTNFIIPPHRGPLHTMIAAAVFGFLCFFVSVFFFSLDPNVSLLAFSAGVIGYSSHILVDILSKN